MASPIFQSFSNILKAMVQQYNYLSGINDLNKGAVNYSFLETAALSDYKTQTAIMSALSANDIDRATGVDLDNIGYAAGVGRVQATNSNGTITISQQGMTKVSTNVYQGTAAPPAGSISINIASITNFPQTGTIYIGRGTNNLESIAYSSIVAVGSYFQVNLSTATTKNHNTGETVILAQGGNRVIQAGSITQTGANLTVASVQFRTVNNVTLLDGEEQVTNVPVICTQVGTIGNIGAGAIVSFTNAPFPNAVATNPLAFVSGKDVMNDPDYRELIKETEQSRVKGTPLAIEQAAVGVTSTDDNQTVTSSSFRQPINRSEPGILFIDNSMGYEPIFSGQGFERIIDDANGGELYLQLQQQDLVKACVVSSLTAPFGLTGGMTLAVKVGGVLSTHTFNTSDFATAGAATTSEILNSINSDSTITFSARAADNSSNVVIFAKAYTSEDIQVVPPSVGVDANQYLGFPTTLTYSLRLYKNDNLLIKDGVIPTLTSNAQNVWNPIATGATLQVLVDQTSYQTATINDADFVPYGYSTVNKNNSLASWASVLNTKIAGVTFTVQGDALEMQSNLGANNNAYLSINSVGTLSNPGQNMWNPGTSQGAGSDYALNRATGQVELTTPAVAGDVITAGSQYTNGFIDSATFTSGSLTLNSTPTPELYFILDQPAAQVSVNLSSAVTVTVSNPSTNTWQYTFSVVGCISGLKKDDLVIITNNNTSLASNNVGDWRVNYVDSTGTYFQIIKTTGTAQGPFVLTGASDFIFVRSPLGQIQTVTLPTGNQTLTSIATAINTVPQLNAVIINGTSIRVSTLTFSNTAGSIFLAGQNSTATTLGFTIGDEDSSQLSHIAFNISNPESTFIEFFEDSIASGNNVSPYSPIVTTTNLASSGYSPNDTMVFLNPFGTNISSNRKIDDTIAAISGTSVTLRSKSSLDEIITNDRYYLSVPYDFDYQDNLICILDDDTLNKTFNMSLSREGKVYQSTNASSFNAYDIDFGPTGNFPSSFGNNFNFADFKIHFNAKQVITPSGSNNQILVSSASFGPTGNQTRVGIVYPQTASAPVSYSVLSGPTTSFNISLASGSLRTGGTWDATTQFDVTNTTGNTYRYTYNGNGTAANFLSASIVVGDIVSITPASTFNAANQGSFKITAITNMYFEVTNYTPGVAETGRTLSSASSLQFFPLNAAANTATLIGSYINSNTIASQYITIAQLTAGTGVISTSTLDDSSGANASVSLVDGENWISSSSIGTVQAPTNTFNLKVPLTVFGPNLINQEFYLIPTRADQLNRFLNVFAVSGISSAGNVSEALDGKALEIYSSLFGSAGSVYVTGGTGNSVSAAVTISGAVVNNQYLKFSIPLAAAGGFHSGQWVDISNTETVAKITSFNPTTQLTWAAATPILSQSTITVTNSNTANNYANGYFWTSRWHDSDNTTQIRVEKQGQFVALTWTGTGTAPNFTKTYTISNTSRTSGVSTITTSAAHGITVGRSIELVVSGTTDTSYLGTFRAVAASTTTFTYLQTSSPTAASAASSGSAIRQVRKTDRINISGAFNTANQGEFRVVAVQGSNIIYIENSLAVEEDVTLSSNSNIALFDYDSVRPGDTFSVGSNVLNSSSPAEVHQGTYTVAALTSSENAIIITATSTQTVTATLGVNFNNVLVIEEFPFFMFAKIQNLSLSPSNSNYVDVTINGVELASKITPSAGSAMSAVSKLGFNTLINVGEDSYKYYGGLIAAVGQEIRGNEEDPINYPGVAAGGSYIEVETALPLEVKVSVVIRNRTGTPFNIIQSRVQSAVAAYINSVDVGQPVVFSEIIVAAQSIDGIQAVSISSPTYNSTDDQIIAQPNQKPLVIDINTDVIVSQAG